MLAGILAAGMPSGVCRIPIMYIPVLATLFKSGIQIGSDNSLVQLGTSNVFHAVESILMGVVFDEAEPAGGFVESIEAHDEALNLAAPGYQVSKGRKI